MCSIFFYVMQAHGYRLPVNIMMSNMALDNEEYHQGPLVLTWVKFNPNTDE